MANYKSDSQSITVAGIKIPIPHDAVIIDIMYAHLGVTTAKSLDAHGSAGGVYSVTAGKKLIIMGVKVLADGTGGGTIALSQGDTEDATTSVKFYINVGGPNSYVEQFIQTTITAGKFVTSNPSGTQVEHITVIGYEVNA